MPSTHSLHAVTRTLHGYEGAIYIYI